MGIYIKVSGVALNQCTQHFVLCLFIFFLATIFISAARQAKELGLTVDISIECAETQVFERGDCCRFCF